MINKGLELVLELIYPPKCISCEDIIPLKNERWICSNCKHLFNYIEGYICKSCGTKVDKENKKCVDCIEANNLFTQNIPIFLYEDIIQDIIYKFKYGRKSYIGKGLGTIMVNRLLLTSSIFYDIDYIVPIPIHKNRLKTRGFNQSEIIAKEISKATSIPMVRNLIFRIKDTKPQSKFSPLGRKNNLKDAFIVNKKYNLSSKKVLLIDDIYTTGITLNSCSQVLYKSGADEVRASTFSIVLKSRKGIKLSSNNVD